MNFTVAWEPSALHEFHEIWAVSPQPGAIRAARERIEQLLVGNPFSDGRHLSEGLWRLHNPPLIVCYTGNVEARLVEITDVFTTGS